jgi:hypothetical protein
MSSVNFGDVFVDVFCLHRVAGKSGLGYHMEVYIYVIYHGAQSLRVRLLILIGCNQ